MVIGILIALNINNWNDNIKTKQFEYDLLVELHKSLKEDIPRVKSNITENIKGKTSCQIILDHFKTNAPYHDSLNFHFARANVWWKIDLRCRRNAYENAKNHGLHFIVNDTNRVLLTYLFAEGLPSLETLDTRQQDYHYNTRPIQHRHHRRQ